MIKDAVFYPLPVDPPSRRKAEYGIIFAVLRYRQGCAGREGMVIEAQKQCQTRHRERVIGSFYLNRVMSKRSGAIISDRGKLCVFTGAR